jgi:hypothetical protein
VSREKKAVNENRLEFGNILYDESKMVIGRQWRRYIAYDYVIVCVFMVSIALLLTWSLFHVWNSDLFVMAVMIMFFVASWTAAIGIVFATVSLGFLQVYENGIAFTGPPGMNPTFWPFSVMEKIALVAPEDSDPMLIVHFKEGAKVGKLRSIVRDFEDRNKIADYQRFVAALRGRIKLENL